MSEYVAHAANGQFHSQRDSLLRFLLFCPLPQSLATMTMEHCSVFSGNGNTLAILFILEVPAHQFHPPGGPCRNSLVPEEAHPHNLQERDSRNTLTVNEKAKRCSDFPASIGAMLDPKESIQYRRLDDGQVDQPSLTAEIVSCSG